MAQRNPSWPDVTKSRYLGKAIPRVDGPDKVSGSAKYTYDIVLEGMLYGKFLRCPHANAKIVSIDTTAAKNMPGVHAVIDRITTECRYAGQEIAAVAAESEEIAEDAIRAIKVQYEVLPHVVNTRVGKNQSDRVGQPNLQQRGSVATDVWAKAAAIVEGEYYVPVREHLSLETHGVVARWNSENSITIWISTQAVHGVAGDFASAFGIPRENVEVICEYMGGGFGSKFSAGIEGLTATRLARMTNRPVKVMFDRYGEQVSSGNGPDALMQCKAGMAADGTLLVVEANLWGTSGPSTSWGVPFPYNIYRFQNQRVTQQGVSTNTGGSRALRAPGHPQGNFLMETVLDELACKLGLDPLEVRIKNQNSEVREKQFRLGAERIGWSKRNKEPKLGSARYYRGMGCAGTAWGSGGAGGSICDIRIENNGTVWVGIGTQDLGTGTKTLVAAIVAEELNIPIEWVKAAIGKSTLGNSVGSGGSVTAASVAPTVLMAAYAAKQRLFEFAASALNVSADSLTIQQEKIVAPNGTSVGFKELCSKLPPGGIAEQGRWNRDLQTGGVAGAQFVEVEVDAWTGNIQPIKVVAVQDCGFAINKSAAESQVIGGVIQGISMALLEDRLMDDPTGRMLNPNMETYKVLGAMEVPEMEPIMFPLGDKVSVLGEPPVIPTAAALGNAVFNATGIRLRQCPMTPKKWFDALEAQS